MIIVILLTVAQIPCPQLGWPRRGEFPAHRSFCRFNAQKVQIGIGITLSSAGFKASLYLSKKLSWLPSAPQYQRLNLFSCKIKDEH